MNPVERLWVTPRHHKLFAWHVFPESTPKALILLVHGHGEHSKRYLHWADRFVSNGYAFLTWDHIGHGHSDGQRGHIHHYEQLLLEIDLAVNKAKEYFPNTPIILYGHSMGGNIVLNHAIRRCCSVDGIIATSPWLRLTKQASPILETTVTVLNYIAHFIPFKSSVNPSEISHLEDEVAKYKEDKLIHNKITPRLYVSIRRAGLYVLKYAKRIKSPTLLMHGEADQITSFEATKEISTMISGCTFVSWPNMYHELHNETVRGLVFETILKWIDLNILKK
ncbi:MAG: alpha/beta hydrolase [Bacteroidales bacterium]|nr:MAG: alpha/beta hydrolase [Bacteroidales bacterium]